AAAANGDFVADGDWPLVLLERFLLTAGAIDDRFGYLRLPATLESPRGTFSALHVHVEDQWDIDGEGVDLLDAQPAAVPARTCAILAKPLGFDAKGIERLLDLDWNIPHV